MDSATFQFLKNLPKSELHLHIEGTLEPEFLFSLSKRNHIQVKHARNIDHLKSLYNFNDLSSFLELYYRGVEFLQNEQDFYDLTLAYMKQAKRDGCRHVEIFFDPQSHTRRGVKFETVINGISRALDEARDRLGVSSYLIMCFLRDLSEEDGLRCLEEATPFLDKIKGVGLDSCEVGNPPEKFKHVFERAKSLGLKRVAHAGEEGPADNIRKSLKILDVSRIDHGVRCADDPDLLKYLADNKIALTVCPFSNVKLKVFDRIQDHNLKQLMDRGIRVTINSDDPAYFGGYLMENYAAVYEKLGLSIEDMVSLAKNSFEGSFLPIDDIDKYVKEIDELYENYKQLGVFKQ